MTRTHTPQEIADMLSGQRPLDLDSLRAFGTNDDEGMRELLTELRTRPAPEGAFNVKGSLTVDAASKDSVYFETFWWGFELHFTEEAMESISKARDVAAIISASVTAAAIGTAAAPVAAVLALAIAIRWGAMHLADQGKGIKLVSPWPWPLALVPWPRE